MSKNDITGDEIKSKANNDNYANNFDKIFGKIICSNCAGCGFIHSRCENIQTCEVCKGTGKVSKNA